MDFLTGRMSQKIGVEKIYIDIERCKIEGDNRSIGRILKKRNEILGAGSWEGLVRAHDPLENSHEPENLF